MSRTLSASLNYRITLLATKPPPSERKNEAEGVCLEQGGAHTDTHTRVKLLAAVSRVPLAFLSFSLYAVLINLTSDRLQL